MRCLIVLSLLTAWCSALGADDDGLLSVASDFDAFLENLLHCRDTHFNCLKNNDEACTKSFGRCVAAYPMLTNSTIQSLGINGDDHVSYGLKDKWKSAMSKVKSTITSVIGKGKDIIGKGKEKITEIFEKVKKIKMTDILEPIKKLPKVLKIIPAALKRLLVMLEGIPPILHKNMKKAVDHCEQDRLECRAGSSTAKKALCDVRFPACVPSYLACNAIATPVMTACGMVTAGSAFGICKLFGAWDGPGDAGAWIGFLCSFTLTALLIPAYAICAGPAYILTGCPLASLPPFPIN